MKKVVPISSMASMALPYSYPFLDVPELEEYSIEELKQSVNFNLLDDNEEDNYEY